MAIALSILYYILRIYFYVLIAYVLLSWIPEIRQSKFYYYLHQIADPYLRLFRGIIVIGYMDFTPIVGFVIYGFGLQAFGMFINSL
ncbi:MAG: YggT family protein [Candidatus Izemoplasmataceae bacterium]|jgi:YggT family protein